MKFCNRILLFLLLTISAAISGEPLPAARDVLPAGAWNYGIPDITDRAYWNARKDSPVCRNKIKRADKLDASTFQAPGDDLYLQFVRNGNRSNYERAYFALCGPLWRVSPHGGERTRPRPPRPESGPCQAGWKRPKKGNRRGVKEKQVKG